MAGKVLDERLFNLLVCPVCHHPVTAVPHETVHAWLHCVGCGRYYPVQDGIPVMIESRAVHEPSFSPTGTRAGFAPAVLQSTKNGLELDRAKKDAGNK